MLLMGSTAKLNCLSTTFFQFCNFSFVNFSCVSGSMGISHSSCWISKIMQISLLDADHEMYLFGQIPFTIWAQLHGWEGWGRPLVVCTTNRTPSHKWPFHQQPFTQIGTFPKIAPHLMQREEKQFRRHLAEQRCIIFSPTLDCFSPKCWHRCFSGESVRESGYFVKFMQKL